MGSEVNLRRTMMRPIRGLERRDRVDPHLKRYREHRILIVHVRDKSGMGGVWKLVWLVTKLP